MTARVCRFCGRVARSGGLCAVHQRRRTLGEPMIQPHDEVGTAVSGFGLLGIVDRTEDGVLCHECGRWLGGLAWHISKIHGMSIMEYRDKHQLPATVPLVSLSTSQRLSVTSIQRMGTPEWRRFVERRDQTNPTSRLLAVAGSQNARAGTKAIRARQASTQFAGRRRADDDRWRQRLAEVVEHWRRTGRTPLQTGDTDHERALGCWWSKQWALQKRQRLSETRLILLESCEVPPPTYGGPGRR